VPVDGGASVRTGVPGTAEPALWAWQAELGSDVLVGTTSVAAGSFVGADPETLARRQRSVVALPWTVLHQVHGIDVVGVARPGDSQGRRADASVTAQPGAVLAVLTADCAPVVLASRNGVIGAAHAGWRGLAAGVLAATVGSMRTLGAEDIVAALGPCIGPECYEFGADRLKGLANRFGSAVVGQTASGEPALDLRAGVAAALEQAGVQLAHQSGQCTACASNLWSWRARRDEQRQATAVWRT
jgi:YfiH family protein